MKKFIFFGRLVREKGIEIILDTFSALHKKGVTDWTLEIYGIGSYQAVCEEFAKLLPHNVVFHGRCEGENRAKVFPKYDFCLMPSLLIESFGLTALESIRAGVPVIGFKKGGVEPFVSNQLNIEHQPGASYTEKLSRLVENLIESPHGKNYYLPDVALSDYSTSVRLTHFQELAGSNKRVLIISDFIKRIGGIENYIHDVKELLENNGYLVEIWGANKKNSFRGLVKTGFNIGARRKLRKKIKEFRPDLIRCHSVIRELGRLPLSAIPRRTKVLMMFHDVGYFHPYSSEVYSLGTLPKDASLHERIRAGGKTNPLMSILLILKWLSLRVVKKIFRRHSTTYLVPSAFMQPFAENLRAGKGQKVLVLEHFVK